MSLMTDTAIAEILAAEDAKTIVVLSVDDVVADPDQPRKQRSEQAILDMAETIKADGQLQPILVYEDGDKYKIAIGEGRWLACHHIPSRTVEAIIIQKLTAARILAMQVIENIQREAMHPLDEARAFQRLIELKECKTAAEVARRVGKSEATISQALKLLKTDEPIQDLVKAGVAKIDAALDLHEISKKDPEAAQELIDEAKQKGLLERKKTREVKQQVEQKAPAAKPPAKPAPAPAPAPKAEVGERGQLVLVRKGRVRVKVGIKPGSKHASRFRVAMREGGPALLVADGVHTDSSMAWVEFGEDREAFPVDDLVMVSVFVEQG